jgi:hypothetical protein
MIKLLADNDAEGHLAILVRVLSSESWIAIWNDLELTVVTFEELGLDRNASDVLVWRTCQREEVVLITNNRNAQGTDSLEMVLREENQPDSLPVFTLGTPDRVRTDRDYAERAAVLLLDYLGRLDSVRGAGRIFIP